MSLTVPSDKPPSKPEEKHLNFPSKLDDAQQAVLDLKATMDEEASALIEERADFENMRKKLDTVHFKKHVKLNVGGQVYKTSVETLVKDPDSMLAAMFSKRFDVKPDEDDEAYFIDRDGTHFRYILNYLRTGQLIYPKENKVLAKELYLEAKFYQIIDVQKTVWQGGEFRNSSYIISNLNDEQKNALLSWLPPQDIFINWVQLYSSSLQGWSTATFHQICNNKGPTVIIARASNYVFGGYAEVSWNSANSFVKDENAFLFTLANPTGARPTKLPQKDDNGGIWCNGSYGPAFGTPSGNCICFMTANGNYTVGINNNYVSVAVPEGQSFTNFIYGNTTSFNMNYLEVFGLKEC